MRRRHLLVLLFVAAAAPACFTAACRGPAVLAPPPDLRAASVDPFFIEIEFAAPLERASAEATAHYALHPAGSPDVFLAIHVDSLVDFVYGRTVRILVRDGLADSTDYVVTTSGVRALDGRSTGDLRASFRTGLSYGTPLRALFAQHCDACHGPSRADGNYRTDSYAALQGPGTSPIRNLIPGNRRCEIRVRTKPQNSMFDQGRLSYLDSEIILHWIENYQARQ